MPYTKKITIDSGVIEASCKSFIEQLLKQSGMHWKVFGANNTIALRCSTVSNRWEDYRKYRVYIDFKKHYSYNIF